VIHQTPVSVRFIGTERKRLELAEQLAPALQRINNFFAPVISSDTFVRLLGQPA